jgi:hypothetical protein
LRRVNASTPEESNHQQSVTSEFESRSASEIIDLLERLISLFDAKRISQEEFHKLKASLMRELK